MVLGMASASLAVSLPLREIAGHPELPHALGHVCHHERGRRVIQEVTQDFPSTTLGCWGLTSQVGRHECSWAGQPGHRAGRSLETHCPLGSRAMEVACKPDPWPLDSPQEMKPRKKRRPLNMPEGPQGRVGSQGLALAPRPGLGEDSHVGRDGGSVT